MNIEKIAVNGHYIWIDKDAEIKEGDYCINLISKEIGKCFSNKAVKSLGIKTFSKNEKYWDNSFSKKIIAASPELNLEGVKSYVEWLAKDYANNSAVTNYEEGINVGKYQGFIKGYQTAEKELLPEQRVKDLEKRLYDCSKTNADLIGKINELPTWGDVRKAIELARLIKEDGSVEDSFTAEDISGCTEVCTYGWGNKHSEEEIIEQLKQSKK